MTDAPLRFVPGPWPAAPCDVLASGPAGALLAVWDVRGGYHDWPHWREAYEWAQTHGLDPDDAYRIEFYLVDVPYARVDRYKVNGDGRRYLDPETGEPAAEEVVVMLGELLPQHLRCFQ